MDLVVSADQRKRVPLLNALELVTISINIHIPAATPTLGRLSTSPAKEYNCVALKVNQALIMINHLLMAPVLMVY